MCIAQQTFSNVHMICYRIIYYYFLKNVEDFGAIKNKLTFLLQQLCKKFVAQI